VIRVLVVDDHSVVRAGVRLLLDNEDDIEAVGEAADAREALEMAGKLTPDVVLMDVGLPGTTGVDAAAEIRHILPDVRILMLSMQDEPSYVRQAFANGAIGYVLKEAADAELVTAVRRVASGERYVHPTLGAKLVGDSGAPRREDDPLSDREREALSLLALGHTCAPSRLTARTSSPSCGSRPGPSWCATQSTPGCSTHADNRGLSPVVAGA